MIPDPFEHVLYQLLNSALKQYPFEHLYVEDVFPKEFYHQILSNLPTTDQYTSIEKLGKVTKGAYLERFIFPLLEETISTLPEEKNFFWQNFRRLFVNEAFEHAVSFFFSDSMNEKFTESSKPKLEWTVDLVRDKTNYSIGPHTDSRQKVISLIFYLPENDNYPNIGTSLFAPDDPDYSDSKGMHHSFEEFKLIKTMPFKPNTMFGFIRTDTSWHGVVPIKEIIERNSISFQLMFNP